MYDYLIVGSGLYGAVIAQQAKVTGIVANYTGELYSLPFNMYTFSKMWG